MVSRRNLLYRLELRALLSVHFWRGVRHFILCRSATFQSANRFFFTDNTFDEEHRNAVPGRESEGKLAVGNSLERSVENNSAAPADKALRFSQHRVVGDFRKPVGVHVRPIAGEKVLMRGNRCEALTNAIGVDHFETFALLKKTRDGRFTRTRKPAYHDKSRRPACRIARGQLEVA